MTRRLAIIPAHGSSKRLPYKNILPLLGRPIIAHTVEATTRKQLLHAILLSTEVVECADAAHAAKSHQRAPSLATDAATLTESASPFSRARSARGAPSIPSPASMRRRRCDAPTTLSPLLSSLSALTSTIALAVTT